MRPRRAGLQAVRKPGRGVGMVRPPGSQILTPAHGAAEAFCGPLLRGLHSRPLRIRCRQFDRDHPLVLETGDRATDDHLRALVAPECRSTCGGMRSGFGIPSTRSAEPQTRLAL